MRSVMLFDERMVVVVDGGDDDDCSNEAHFSSN